MKRSVVIGIGLLGLAAAPAMAADLPVKARPMVPAAVGYNWSGCYLGVYGGGAFRNRPVDAQSPITTEATPRFYNAPDANTANGGLFSYNLENAGGMFGGTLGCNWQAPGSAFVFGVEGEGGYMRLRGAAVDPYSVTRFGSDSSAAFRIGNYDAILAGRIGYAFDRVLFYGKAGGGFTRIEGSFSDNCVAAPCGIATLNTIASRNVGFWAAGAGIEYAFDRNWTIKGEYLYLGLNDSVTSCGGVGPGVTGITACSTESIRGVHTAKIGLNWKFDWGGPVIARY
jgi:outer membrane immunogenic protein